MVLEDSFGRPLLNLRIAVTKRCNLRCPYCHGEGEQENGKTPSGEMTAEEIVRTAKIAADLGILRVKLTGGEPLMRRDILEIVGGISAIRGLKDFSMTTNGSLLAPQAEELRAKGLQRLNVSLPTLEDEVYAKLTGGRVSDVMDGIREAIKVGFSPVKLNTLVLKGVNDLNVPDMIEYAGKTGAILQLIELEPVNVSADYFSLFHESLDKYEAMVAGEAASFEARKFMQNRRVYNLPHARVEIVRPLENTEFCMHCTRLRVTSDGMLKPCFMRNDDLVDLLTPMRAGTDDQQLSDLFVLANSRRRPHNQG